MEAIYYDPHNWNSGDYLPSSNGQLLIVEVYSGNKPQLDLCPIGEGNGNPLQCSCLENPREGGDWWAAVSGVTQSRTRLKWRSSSSRLVPTCSRPISCSDDEKKKTKNYAVKTRRASYYTYSSGMIMSFRKAEVVCFLSEKPVLCTKCPCIKEKLLQLMSLDDPWRENSDQL